MTATAPAGPVAVRVARSGVGATVWLTGLPSAGKTTVARAAAKVLAARGVPVEVLDGDEVRPHLSAGLGFTRADRDVNVTRIGWVARLLARHGVVVLVAVVAPFRDTRDAVRAAHRDAGVGYAEVYVSTPVAECARRDVKGLYAAQRAGRLSGLTGVDDPYEPPDTPDAVLDTGQVALTDAVDTVLALLGEAPA